MSKPNKELHRAYQKIKKVIFSCETMEQLHVARKMAVQFDILFLDNNIYDMSYNLRWADELQERKINATTKETK